MEKNENELLKNEKYWMRIAYIAGAFSFILCMFLIVNYFQVNRVDPVNVTTIDALIDRLNDNPQDQELREEIRSLDLLARKAYFTSQWQIRTGGYLLLIGVAIVIIAFQIVLANRKKRPLVSTEVDQDFFKTQQIKRKWVTYGGTAVVITALVFAFLSHRDMKQRIELASGPAEIPGEQVEEIPDNNVQQNSQKAILSDTINESDDDKDEIVQVETETEQDTEPDVEVVEPDVSKTSEATQSVSNANFTNFRGPGSNGIAVQTGLPINWNVESGENICWKVSIPLPGFNSPIIWADRIFLSGADKSKREIYCIDKANGELLWTVPVTDIPDSPAKGPEVANYTGYAAPTMACDAAGVYAIFSNGDIIALDHDGKRLWAKNLGPPVNHYGHSSSLMVYNEKVIVQYDQKNIKQVLALSTKNGETVWSQKRNVKVSWASPVIVNTGSRMEVILAAEPFVISYNPDTGEEIWRVDCIYGEVGPSVCYIDGIVYVMNDYSKLSAIKLGATPEVIWEDEEYLSDIPCPVVTDKVLIIPTSYGVIAGYDPKSGEMLWEVESDNSIYASPLISENKVYLIDKEGVMFIFEAEREYKLISQPELGEQIVCTPAFSENRIYLRGYDNLYCIGQK